MKIRCDVCNDKDASVFCCPDEAALCSRCDERIHGANKLSEKHRRFSLLDTSFSSSPDCIPPFCDVCQKKRGFFFCQEDRAILCMDCNISIHNANIHSRKHNRFLLSGVRVSSDPLISFHGSADPVPEISANSSNISSTNSSPATMIGNNSSSISEYLTKLLPGWLVEDFLFDDATAIDKNNNEVDEMCRLPIWVPNPDSEHLNEGSNIEYHDQNTNKRQRNCMVPQFCGIGHSGSKRHRS